MNLESLKTTLQGKRTYIATGMGVLYITGVFLGLWDWDERVLGIFGLGGLAFLRAAVPKATAAVTTSTASTPIPPITPILLISLLLLTGCTTLEQPGPYNGDRILYNADQSIAATYETLNAFVSWEYQQREILARWPEIRTAADHVRAHAPSWIDTAIAVRDRYAASQDADTRQDLVAAIADLHVQAANATTLRTLYGSSNSH